ncbi:MAG: tetratricopeptide repeat protein, partial [Acidobacteria bacterium]|nr:tetratricopeptide repeat protein [Candidatus Polarisedimenticola svalbardensis]
MLLFFAATDSPATPIKSLPEDVFELLRTGRGDDAVSLARSNLTQAEREHGKDSLESATASQNLSLSMSFGKVGSLEERLELAQRALEIQIRLLSARDPLVAATSYTMGQAHFQAADYPGSVPHFKDALVIVDDYFGPYAIEVHDYVREYGAALTLIADYELALTVTERLVAIITDHSGPDHPKAVDAYNNLARIYTKLDRYQDSETVLRRLVDTIEQRAPPDLARLFQILQSLSITLSAQGRFDDGLAAGEKALSIIGDSPAISSLSRARLLNNLSHILINIGDFEKAFRYLDTAESLIPAGENYPDIAMRVRINQALCHHGLGDHRKALALMEKAAPEGSEPIRASAPVMAGFHNYSGRIARSAGALAAAESAFRNSIRILENQGNGNGFDAAEATRDLALVELDQGKYLEAKIRLQRAAGLMEKLTGRAHPEFIRLLDGLAHVQLRSGSKSDAIATGLEADKLHAQQIADTVSGLPERQALTLVGQRRGGLEAALRATISGGGDKAGRRAVAEAVFRSRAVVFDELVLRSDLAAATRDPALSDLVERLRTTKATLSNLYIAGPGENPD